MKILLICPNQQGINNIPEIRTISELHRTYVLSGPLTVSDIYQAVTRQEYDIIHVATHTIDDNVFDKFAINANENLTIEDLVKLGKLSKATLFFFNSCHSARSAYFITRRLKVAAIYTTINILDSDAWKLPLTFYQAASDAEKNGKKVIYKTTFDAVDDESGTYGFVASAETYDDMISHLSNTVDNLTTTVAAIQQSVKQLDNTVKTNAETMDAYMRSNRITDNKIFIGLFVICIVIMTISASLNILGVAR